MRTRHISFEEWETICSRDESHFFDLKAREITGKAIQKIAVAFANADGGEVIVGVADKKSETDPIKRWQGFTELEATNGLLQALFEIKPSLTLQYEILRSDFGAGILLRVEIEKSADVAFASDETVFQRQGAQSLPIKNPEKIRELGFAKGATTFEDELLPSIQPEQIVETNAIEEFRSQVVPKSDALDLLLNLNLLDYKSWTPRVAGVLLFADVPSALVPRKCSVKITRYETREDDPERDHLAFQKTLDGPLYQLIGDTIDAIVEIMSQVKIWTSSGIGTLNYPPEAIWETVTNAFIHRDYSISDDVQILIFDNRIEIMSPGRLPGYVTLENILEARYSRNPKIVKTLSRYASPPNKDMGEGLNTTFQKMKEFGLKSPEIFEEGNYIKVVLPHSPLAAPGDAIMTFLENSETITNRQAREITGIKSENLVKIEFYKLRDAGLLEQVPGLKGPKSAWQKSTK